MPRHPHANRSTVAETDHVARAYTEGLDERDRVVCHKVVGQFTDVGSATVTPALGYHDPVSAGESGALEAPGLHAAETSMEEEDGITVAFLLEICVDAIRVEVRPHDPPLPLRRYVTAR
jgi:hypothetical protein